MIARQPIYAGAHYFGDAGRLRASVESWIEDAHQPRVDGDLLGLIVPRGLHREVGPLAGAAYKALLTSPLHFDAVTLLAPNLRQPELALACDPADAYETPLDLAPIDRVLVDRINAGAQLITPDTDPDDVIEAQLPFLQTALGVLPVLPLRVGNAPHAGNGLLPHAGALGFIVITANLPVGQEKTALALIQDWTLDASQVVKPGGFLGLAARGKLSAWSADLQALALGLKLLKAQGATGLQILDKSSGMTAIAVYR